MSKTSNVVKLKPRWTRPNSGLNVATLHYGGGVRYVLYYNGKKLAEITYEELKDFIYRCSVGKEEYAKFTITTKNKRAQLRYNEKPFLVVPIKKLRDLKNVISLVLDDDDDSSGSASSA